MKRIIAILIGLILTSSIFSMVGCKNKNDTSTDKKEILSEEDWSDENVDNNAWT